MFMQEIKNFLLMTLVFLICFYVPVDLLPWKGPLFAGLALVQWYTREHVLLCLVPAFFIAGAISVFISQTAIIKYFGAQVNKFLSYSVAAISGAILAVCSCTVLPLFAGIYSRGAGLGPAIAFLYSGPAINVLAMIITAKILGWQLGVARAFGAITFSIVIGLLMHVIFINEESSRTIEDAMFSTETTEPRTLWQNIIYFFTMIALLVFANWAKPPNDASNLWLLIFAIKWYLVIGLLIIISIILLGWFKQNEIKEWMLSAWSFAKQIMPLLLIGVLISGLLFGRHDQEGFIPSWLIVKVVGCNSVLANFFAAIVGAVMYFATLTEVPILQGLISAGMNKGPALALLLAGPALSLPNMLVIRKIIGTKKTIVYLGLVVVMATGSGVLFGIIAN